ncbi:MAG: hypothetical protein JRH10_03905 [Deltaproteobacteria bacterium]|nr:hypothetical protein [Deltaproteobacteria bacterium]MBW2444698.1 hypothetical protein [Deltaproteobacteria bacterium]
MNGPTTTTGGTTFTEVTTEENFGTAANPDWKRVETQETSSTPRPGDSTTVDREIKIRRYEGGSRRTTETVTITEVESPLFTLHEPTIKSRTTTTVTYGNVGGKRKKTTTVVESWEVVRVDNVIVPSATGTRTTTTHGPGGDTTTTEHMDPRTGQWLPGPAPSQGGKKAATKKGPAGLPTNNPGQRGIVVPELPHVPGGYGSKGPKVPVPKSKY